ncbi:phosphotransferase family protein [Microdochium trichocladiopsis]|uniref:Phosphotransferase family protein n=1 Tax=Microdochium trichocladiopsis TaxID=1682393 RepID=A0A9P9BJT3_9PEZI|nr:phosphotransferase family protein [Microdochium trichocladiopsis]KAH7018468.1 phosphotransferase family protein [Microdochium trichocladiopsis]
MPPKERAFFAKPDYELWEANEAKKEAWLNSMANNDVHQAVGRLILKYHPGDPEELVTPRGGSYNLVYRLRYKDGTTAALRVPLQHYSHYPEEKLLYEVALMKYIRANTTIPIPEVYGFGTAKENPAGNGPFIIMEWVHHHMDLGDALNDPCGEPEAKQTLDPNISEEKLESLYEQMAGILLQLYSLDFPRIGSLVLDDLITERNSPGGGSASVTGRPLIQNINRITEWTSAPQGLLPSNTYARAEEWYSDMADMHMLQLVFQRNYLVKDEDDARDKYIARQLFRRLAASGKLSAPSNHNDASPGRDGPPFKLFSEDLRPNNVLLDEHFKIVAVIDWEFAYAAPAQFARDPPWWLLIRQPHHWEGGIEAFIAAYEPRLQTFLRTLRRCEARHEEERESKDAIDTDKPLSQYMQESWEKKLWIHGLCMRNSWLFDHLFWKFIDPLFFGPNEDCDHKKRLELLTDKERVAMERLVKTKMEEDEELKVVDWELDPAREHLATFMV